jgi:hypothetical protein
MNRVILLSIFLFLFTAPARAANFAYEFKQVTSNWGPVDCVLRSDAAKIDAKKVGLEFIFVESTNKVQIVNLNEHSFATETLSDWYGVGLPIFQYAGHPIDLMPLSNHGRTATLFGMNSIYYKGGPLKPVAYNQSRDRNDLWMYSDAAFCKEIPLSKQMNEFIAGAFRIGTEQSFYPLRNLAFCSKSGKHILLDTLSVKRMDESQCKVAFVKGYREVKMTEVMSSKPSEEFASELMGGAVPSKH